MNHEYKCDICSTTFARKAFYEKHLNSRKHKTRVEQGANLYKCGCGRTYLSQKSLNLHKRSCKTSPTESVPVNDSPVTATTQVVVDERIQEMEMKLEEFEKERNELKAQIALLLEKNAEINNKASSSTSNTTNNTNIETQNNTINININAFGEENLQYLDNKMILNCINAVYKSIPEIVEKIHFNPCHPENHNIKITNKKLPYASVMGANNKWQLVDRNDAINKMISHGYDILDDSYRDNREKIPARKRERFEDFQDKYISEDKSTMKNVKSDVELLVLNGNHNESASKI